MSYEPIISIVTVCLNSRDCIEKCINSVFNQTYSNIEYIIIDGGSTDGTLDIIQKYQSGISIIVSEKDNGIYDAMNKGVSLAKGKYIGILNSDDYYDSETVMSVVHAGISNNSPDVIYGNARLVPSMRVSIGSHDALLEKWGIPHPTCFVKSSLYQKFKFDSSMKISADFDFILNLYMVGCTFFHIDEILTSFSTLGISSKPCYKAVIELFKIRKKHSKYVAYKMFISDSLQYLDEVAYSTKSNLKRVLMGS